MEGRAEDIAEAAGRCTAEGIQGRTIGRNKVVVLRFSTCISNISLTECSTKVLTLETAAKLYLACDFQPSSTTRPVVYGDDMASAVTT